jgi:uncharacterized protein
LGGGAPPIQKYFWLNAFGGSKLKSGIMLSVNLHHLESDEIRLQGELSAAELDFGLKDEMIRAGNPLRYDLTVERLDDGLLLTGSLRLVLNCQCVRCLKMFNRELVLEDWTCHLPLVGEEKVRVENDCVDLTPFVREDMLLEFPQHPLCKPECAGLGKIGKGKARKASGENELEPSAWAELDKLKLKI